MSEQEYALIKNTLDRYEFFAKRYLPNAGITERLQIKAARQALDDSQKKQESQTMTVQQAAMF